MSVGGFSVWFLISFMSIRAHKTRNLGDGFSRYFHLFQHHCEEAVVRVSRLLNFDMLSQSDEFIFSGFKSKSSNLTLDGLSKKKKGILKLTNDTSKVLDHGFYKDPILFKNSGSYTIFYEKFWLKTIQAEIRRKTTHLFDAFLHLVHKKEIMIMSNMCTDGGSNFHGLTVSGKMHDCMSMPRRIFSDWLHTSSKSLSGVVMETTNHKT